jgi:hypothetical protein
MCDTSQRRHGLGPKQGKTLVILRPPVAALGYGLAQPLPLLESGDIGLLHLVRLIGPWRVPSSGIGSLLPALVAFAATPRDDAG